MSLKSAAFAEYTHDDVPLTDSAGLADSRRPWSSSATTPPHSAAASPVPLARNWLNCPFWNVATPDEGSASAATSGASRIVERPKPACQAGFASNAEAPPPVPPHGACEQAGPPP